jgi:ligand-binding sensor domain-containing protein
MIVKKTYYLIIIFLAFSHSAYCQSKQENKDIVLMGLGISAAPNIVNQSFGNAFQARNFRLLTIGADNIKWFQTELGIVSFDGKTWKIQDKNRKVPTENIKDISYDSSDFGQELWIASPAGATVASIPIDAKSGATTYYKDNSKILSENVLAVAVGKGSIRWFGTDKGISVFRKNDWLPVSYQRKYPEDLFRDFPITAMATSPDGDSLYAATEGAGVARVYRNDVDAITGASEYAPWGPIEIPSDKVYSICIAAGGKTQWFGTDMGVARHIGYKTLENWTVFNTANGLIDNFVQSIATDRNGNVWFGTKGGVSVFDGTSWNSFTIKDGLPSNNIQCMKMDKEGILWMGTDQGVITFFEGKFTCFK